VMFADCDQVLDNAEAYAIRVLDDDEALALSRHLESCDACRRAVEQAEETSHALALAVPLSTPDASVKARVMAGALALDAVRHPWRRRWQPAMAAGLALIALGALAWGAVLQYRSHNLAGENSALRRDFGAADATRAATDARLADIAAFDDALLAASGEPDAESVRMAGTAIAPAAAGRYVWSESRELGALDVTRMPALADGMTYELTIMYPNSSESGGTFSVDEQGRGTLVVQDGRDRNDIGPPQGFAVVLRPSATTDDSNQSVVLSGTLAD